MVTSTAPHAWVDGDRARLDTAKPASDTIDHILMSDVDFSRARTPTKVADSATSSDQIEIASIFSNSGSNISKLESVGMSYYQSQDQKVFDVRSGQYKGMHVPESLRCAIFQSNIAVEAGIIKPSEVTVRAVEFGQLIKSKGYQQETFIPGKSYPSGTYIVGAGGGREEQNHVGLVLNGKLLHTHEGKILYQNVGDKFYKGAYQSIKVYIPPTRRAA